jgi:hypothetical protein
MKIGFFILKVRPQLSESQSQKKFHLLFKKKKMRRLPNLTKIKERQAHKPSFTSQ